MDYEEFLNSLKNDLQNYYSNAGITIENADVQKMQGESYQGLQIKRDGSNVGITMDMHNFFAELEDGMRRLSIWVIPMSGAGHRHLPVLTVPALSAG